MAWRRQERGSKGPRGETRVGDGAMPSSGCLCWLKAVGDKPAVGVLDWCKARWAGGAALRSLVSHRMLLVACGERMVLFCSVLSCCLLHEWVALLRL